MNVKETEMGKWNQIRQQGLQALCSQNNLLMTKGVLGVLLNWSFTPFRADSGSSLDFLAEVFCLL